MPSPSVEAILPRAETPAEIGALILSSETAGLCLERRLDAASRCPGNTIALSRDEVHEIADRMFRLAQIARTHHAQLRQGQPVEPHVDPAFRPRTWTERLRAAWQRFARQNLVAEAPLNG